MGKLSHWRCKGNLLQVLESREETIVYGRTELNGANYFLLSIFWYRNVVKWGALGGQMGCIRKIQQRHWLDGLMRENSECGKQCRSESMRAELRLLRQPFFFLLFYFFPITLHIFRTRHLKAHSSNRKQNVTSKVKWRCFKLHRHSVQFSEFHLGEFSRV